MNDLVFVTKSGGIWKKPKETSKPKAKTFSIILNEIDAKTFARDEENAYTMGWQSSVENYVKT